MSLPDETAADSGFDLDSAVNEIGSDLGFSSTPDDDDDEPELPETDDESDEAAAPESEQEDEGGEQATVNDKAPAQPAATDDMPKSWPKEKQPLWASLTPDAKQFYQQREKQFLDGLEQYKAGAQYAKQLQDVVAPFRPLLQQQGINEAAAFQYMLTAHANLSTGSADQRRDAFMQIGRDLGILGANDTPDSMAGAEQVQADPVVQELQARLNALESERDQATRARLQQAKVEADTAVEAFAADPANVYFNEVAKDMAVFVRQGVELKDAYDRAVWSNPVTRAKEQARLQTEAAAAAKRDAQQKLDKARAPAAANVRETQSRRTPTEPKGKFLSDESMSDTLRQIKARQST